MTTETPGPTWIRKMRTLFRRLDAHGNGYLMLDDLLNVVTGIFHVFPKMTGYKTDQLVKGLVYLWYQVICTHVDRQHSTMSNINEATFVDNMAKAIKGDFGQNFDEKFVTPLFVGMDQDDDGKITQPEFDALMVGFQSIQSNVDVLFRLHADGPKLSKDSFKAMFEEFFLREDPKSKLNQLWGPLIAYKRAEDYGELDCGPVWEGKMRSMFRRLDVGESMKLRFHDLLQIVQFIIQRNHVDKSKADTMVRSMLQIWVKYLGIDKDGGHLEEIREIDFIHNMRDMINGNYRHEVDQFGWTFFKALEHENTGYITQNVYRTLQEAWHVGRDEGEGMFKLIDVNKNGKISSDEFLTAWNDYFLSEDPHSPFRMFFGPIISRQTEAK